MDPLDNFRALSSQRLIRFARQEPILIQRERHPQGSEMVGFGRGYATFVSEELVMRYVSMIHASAAFSNVYALAVEDRTSLWFSYLLVDNFMPVAVDKQRIHLGLAHSEVFDNFLQLDSINLERVRSDICAHRSFFYSNLLRSTVYAFRF